MGHLMFFVLHFIAFSFGIVGLFITIPLHLIYSAVQKPKGLREDGKRRNGGLLGWMIDDYVVASKMTDCPYCRGKIFKDVTKCKHCGEFLPGKATAHAGKNQPNWEWDKSFTNKERIEK